MKTVPSSQLLLHHHHQPSCASLPYIIGRAIVCARRATTAVLHIADKLIITVRLSEDGNVMAVNFRVWRSVLSPEAVICYACPQFTLVYKLMNKVYTCSAQATVQYTQQYKQ